MWTLHFISNICHLITGDTGPPPLEMSGQKAETHLTVRYPSLREGNSLPETAGHGKGISRSQIQVTLVALGPRKANGWFRFLPSQGLTHLGLLPSSLLCDLRRWLDLSVPGAATQSFLEVRVLRPA